MGTGTTSGEGTPITAPRTVDDGETDPVMAPADDGSGGTVTSAGSGGTPDTNLYRDDVGDDDTGGGGGGGTVTRTPPTVAVSDLAAAQTTSWVKPGTAAVLRVTGRVTVTPVTALGSFSSSVQVTGGTTAVPATVNADGTWTASISVDTTGKTASFTPTVTATATTSFTYSGTTTSGSVSASASFTPGVRVDAALPKVAFATTTLDPSCPLPGEPLNVKLSGNATDADSGISWVAVGTDRNSLTRFTPANPAAWTYEVTLKAVLTPQTVYARAADNVGNLSSDADPASVLVFTLKDRTVPSVHVNAVPRQVYDDRAVPITVSGTATDVHTGVSSVQVALRTAAGVAVGAPVTVTPAAVAVGQPAAWSAALTIPSPGEYRVWVTATDVAGNTCPAVPVTVHADPIPAPVVDITSHDNRQVISGGDEGADIVVKGTARATLTTLTRVEVSVGGGPYVLATNVSGDWSAWSAPVHLAADGEQNVVARATTAARNTQVNTRTDTVSLSVGVRYTARDTQDNTSHRAYFLDLLKFATRRVRIAAGGAVRTLTPAELATQFHQPFDRITADEEVSQVRVCVEVLRGYTAAIGRAADPAAVAAYREAAYRALLVQMGTSYEELRRVRTGTAAERQGLADRLGIGSDAARLDALVLQPDAITEAALESVFGLEATTRDPLAGAPLASYFRARSDHLRTTWHREDHPAGSALAPIVDPDLVSEENIPASKRTAGNLAYSLYTARRAWVNGQLAALAADRVAGESDRARLARLVDKTAAPATMAALLALQAERAAGRDVSSAIAAHGLTPAAFDFLMRIHDATGRGPLLPAEWSEVIGLLVGLAKERRYATWRAEETTLVLGPDDFQPAPLRPLPAWRATTARWREWHERLRARTDQDAALVRAYADAVAAAEAASLPILRDALVAAAAPAEMRTPEGLERVANWLTQRLMVDVQASGGVRTTRMAQAVETLQGILGALRAGRFMEMELEVAPLPPGEWTLVVPDAPAGKSDATFDAEWAWMGSYTRWRAAMRVFLYPENLLVPGLRDATPEFRAMMAARAPGPLSAAAALELAHAYRDAVRANATVMGGLSALVPEAHRAGWMEAAGVLDPTLGEAALPARAAWTRQMMLATATAAELRRYLEEIFFWVPVQLALLLHQAGQHGAALDWYRTVYGYNLKAGERKVYYGLVEEEQFPCIYQTTDQWLRTSLNPHHIAPQRSGALTRFTLLSIARCFLDFADAEFAADGGEASARARTLYLGALELLGSADMKLPTGEDPAVAYGFGVNPEALALRAHAELALLKLRGGRNIAGMERQAAPGRTAAVQAGPPQPTTYRYSVLVDRAKQLVNLAQQMEAQYLAALEKRDAETYNLIKARHDLGLTQATVQLQDLRIDEAAGGVALAALQQSRAQVQKETYRGWIDAGPIQAERDLLRNYRDATRYRNQLAKIDAAATIAQAITTASSGGVFGTGIGAGWTGVAITAGLAIGRAYVATDLNDVEGQAQINSMNASFERRRREWELQAALSEKDEAIGAQQVIAAHAHLRIAGQELTIAQMQANNAAATVEFLASKFTSAELYEWMSGVLGRVYSYFLQQATAIARLAEGQLAFERQEKPLQVIQSDYWQAPADGGEGGDSPARDRRGLTGSARLLQDIHQLDQYAFETNKRKLHLTRTISLAQVAPFELEQLRRTGKVVFATPMELFDRDFPGQYLRLVRRVRTTVVALIPPSQGLRATLAASGLSRVTVAEGGFQTLTVRRDPEMVALTSPAGASGVFDLDVQSELLLPFEGMGVDTTWTLEMQRAANPFDFGTIADVMLTVEYTALHSPDYRQQVIRSLDTAVSGERGISFRDQFPDQWYDLGNGAAGADQTVTFDLSRGMFPPNVDGLRVESLVLYFVPRNGTPVAARASDLRFPVLRNGVPGEETAGAADAVEGVISTRRNRWQAVVGSRPVAGRWSLTLDAATVARVRAGEVEDLLLVLGYGGETPAWM